MSGQAVLRDATAGVTIYVDLPRPPDVPPVFVNEIRVLQGLIGRDVRSAEDTAPYLLEVVALRDDGSRWVYEFDYATETSRIMGQYLGGPLPDRYFR